MNHEKITQQLYTQRVFFYHIFVHVVGYAAAVRKFLSRSDYVHSGMKILDAGCGGGLVAKIMHATAIKNNVTQVTFYGFDITRAMLKYFSCWIEKNKVKNVILAQANVLQLDQLPSDWNNYDLIVVSGMLEYIPKEHIVTAIANLRRLLAPKGKLLIFICRRNWLARWIIEKWWKANIYTQQELIAIISRTGFEVVNFKYFAFPYNYLTSWVFIVECY